MRHWYMGANLQQNNNLLTYISLSHTQEYLNFVLVCQMPFWETCLREQYSKQWMPS